MLGNRLSNIGGKSLGAERTTSVKALKQDCEWHIPERFNSLLSFLSFIYNVHITDHLDVISHLSFSENVGPTDQGL